MNGEGCLNKCPKCNSDEISASNYESGSNDISCDVICEKCGIQWFEIYKAVSWETY